MKFILILLLLTGCSSFTESSGDFKIKLIDSYEIQSTFLFKDKPFGGLSGIVYDEKNKFFWAISDDRSQHDHARIYKLNILSISPLKVEVSEVIYLQDEDGNFFKPGHVDFEGVAILPNGNLILSSESIEHDDFNYPPRIMEFGIDGQLVKNWAVREKYTRKTGEGVRQNKSFESMTYFAGSAYTAVENSLVQDGTEPAFGVPTWLRIAQYRQQKGYFTPCKEFAYQLSALPAANAQEQGDTGLVELLGNDDGSFLALERSFIYNTHRNVVRLFKFKLGKNIMNQYSLKKYVATKKKMVMDFSELDMTLDNLEGMSWGPILSNGHKTLMFVSDNNFNLKQRSLFLLFEVIP